MVERLPLSLFSNDPFHSPTCRSICHLAPEDAPVNTMIKNLAMAVDSRQYSRRLIEHDTEKKHWDTTTPIFFYNGILLVNTLTNNS